MKLICPGSLLVVVLLAGIHFDARAQASKKESIDKWKKFRSLSIDDIRSGKYSDMANEYSLENFISFYMHHGKQDFNKEDGHTYIDSLYQDSQFTYYIHRAGEAPMKLIKVATPAISVIDLSLLDGKTVRNKFLDEIIPQADKDRVEKRCRMTTLGYEDHEFSYFYKPDKREIEVRYYWKVSCDLIRAIKKTYTASYHIDQKIFVK